MFYINIFTEPLFYIIIFIVLAIVVGIVVFFILSSPAPNKTGWENEIVAKLTEASIPHQLTKSNNNLYDFELVIEDKKYLIKLLGIPSYSEVQINNVTTWEIKFGAGKNPGKVQPFKRYAQGIEGFMNLVTKQNEQRVVILSPDAKKITKYINECEIVFVNSKTNVYNVRVINESDFSLFIKK